MCICVCTRKIMLAMIYNVTATLTLFIQDLVCLTIYEANFYARDGVSWSYQGFFLKIHIIYISTGVY